MVFKGTAVVYFIGAFLVHNAEKKEALPAGGGVDFISAYKFGYHSYSGDKTKYLLYFRRILGNEL